ncbi:serine/threonine protein kinase [Streptomyces sp. IMTB 2501]|uniref:serine/threonine-protein kinase n=1 Tax=Streptomyces sp. IMTB 2501 TaxID=1776340 RepID=UPI00096CD521|nr:serine/threonine-protein kinase [Streptomyces sp. IMTB 2501]OLZ65093.1 serine/threonine protein kinase [Streptomyces sp. IMTB 2501]
MQPLDVDEPAAVGPYRLLGRLGSGGMGRVYLGRSAGGRTVAVKIVHPHFALDEEFRARFRREVAAARRVGSAWTAPVLDADPDAPVPWVATAYAAGPSLAAAVTDTGPLPAHTVRALGAGLAEALTTVHELGLVHRDVKPSNVLLTLDGPLLIDFGIARAMDGTASLTSTGVSVGSPGYMAPEQILGKGATGAADVFSLGAVLTYAATGEPPFRGDSSAALLYKVVHEEPELGPLSGELHEVAAACLTKDPAARPTPADLSRRLAPEGAARLITGGWLPGPLVEQVSRSAVHLLNLDTGEIPHSGPVPFDTPAKTEPPAPASAASATGAGVFGPPPVMNPAEPPPTPPGEPTVVPAQRDAPPPGRVSVSMAAAATPVEGARGRRLSCTVVLAVAGALAVGALGLGALLRPWSQQNEDKGAGTAPSLSHAPTAASSAATGGTGAPDNSPSPGTIPARYLGTWEGTATGLGGAVPMGTFRLTVRQAAVGKELGRLRQTDAIGGVCTDVLTLKEVTKTQILATSVGAADNPGHCVPTPHQVELTPVGDDLKFTSDSSAEGNPVARLSKVE